MQKIRSVLIDDEKRAISYLETLFQESCPEIEVIGSAQTVEQAIALVEQKKPDLMFLDIQLNGSTGFDLLESLVEIDFDVIFTTAYSHYTMEAIKASALDYLLKPIDTDELTLAIQKHQKRQKNTIPEISTLLERLRQGTSSKISVSDYHGISFYDLNEIVRFQGDGNYCKIYLENGQELLSTRRMKDYESTVHHHNFLRVHQSHLINLGKVRRFVHGKTGTAVMDDGSEIEVSRRHKAMLLTRLKSL